MPGIATLWAALTASLRWIAERFADAMSLVADGEIVADGPTADMSGELTGAVVALLSALVGVVLLAGCGGGASSAPGDSPSPAASDAEGALVIYSGRSEELVDPILRRFEELTGADPASVKIVLRPEGADWRLEA